MPDFAQTRSEYLKVMMGNRHDALAPYRPEQMNDVGDTSFDVASLSDEDINTALKNMEGTQYQNTEIFKALQTESEGRKAKAEEESQPKQWWEQIGDFFTNIGTAITEGIFNVVDDIWDFAIGVVGGIGGGWWGAENGFTDWVASAMTDDRWVTYATDALTSKFVFNPVEMLYNAGNSEYWDNYWNYDYEALEKKYERNYEGMEWLHKGGNFVGELIPSLVLAYFTGGASLGAQAAIQGGLGFARAYGRSSSQAIEEGATFQQAAGYGALSGTVEAAFSAGSAAMGGLLSSKGSQGAVKTISQKFGQAIGNRWGNGAQAIAGKSMEIILDALGEATEETVENALDPAFRMIYDNEAWYNAYGTDENRRAYFAEMGKAALMAAAGSIIAGGVKEGIEIGKIRKSGGTFADSYAQEIESSERIRALKKAAKESGETDVPTRYLEGQRKYARLEQEDSDFQRRMEKLIKSEAKKGNVTFDAENEKWVFSDADLESRVKQMVSEHQETMRAKYADWTERYADWTERANKLLSGTKYRAEASTISGEAEQDELTKALNAIPKVTTTNQDGVEETTYAIKATSMAEAEQQLTTIKEAADGSKRVTLDTNKGQVTIDLADLSDNEIQGISRIKAEDIKTTDSGNTEYARISNSKVLVFDGESAGIVEARPNASGTAMVFEINGETVPAIGAPLVKTPQAEVESRYGKNAKKSQPSIILEAAEGKNGMVWSYADTKSMADKIVESIRSMVDDNSLPEAFREKYRSLLDKGDLIQEVFAQANLSSESDVQLIRDYIESYIMDSEVKVTLDGEPEIHVLRDMLTTGERAELTKVINSAFDEYMANGRTSRFTELVNDYERRLQSLLSENQRVRERAKLAAETTKNFNTLANKLGLNGKPSQVKTILNGASDADVQIVDMFRGLVRDTKISSRTGLSTSPNAANRIVEWGRGYTVDKFQDSYLWDPAIKMELDAIEATMPDGGFDMNTELSVDTQRHIKNLLSAINSKLNAETWNIYQKRKATASEGVTLFSTTKPVSHTKVGGVVLSAVDNAESFAQYAANHIGKENPAFDALVTDWTKANGTKLSYQQKYTDVANKILQEEGFKAKRGLSFLKKKVEFQGKKIAKGEAASMYFSARTKQGIADGTNTLLIYDEGTRSKSKAFKLNGEADIETLKSLFTEAELRVMERLQKEVIGGVMQQDFVNWFQKNKGYSPVVSDDYFMLNASNERSELSAEQNQFGFGSLMGKTWGRARSRQEYKGAYQIIDFASQFAQYGNDLAHYIGYSDYNDKARIILNTKVDATIDGRTERVSLNELLGRNAPDWSGANGWKRYFEYLANDSKAYDKGGKGIMGLVSKIVRGGQTSVLGLNPRSMAKQWLSDFTVMGDVGIGTYLKSKGRVAYNLSHYKQVRDFMIGASDMLDPNGADYGEYEPYFAIIRERLENKGAIKGKISSDTVGAVSDITLKGMAFFDEANNVINVWSVAETLAHDYDGLDYGTRANKLQAMKYFTDLIFRTQSNNNAMYVSPLRSGYNGEVARVLFGMFASDNQNKLQQVDSILREFTNARRRKKGYEAIMNDVNSTPEQIEMAKKAIAYIDKNYSNAERAKRGSGVVAGLALSGLGAALINETFDRLMAKKDKDGKPKKFSDGFDWATIATQAPLEAFVNWIPYVGTIANTIENNTDMSFFTADRINGLVNASKALFTALQSGDSSKVGKAVTEFILTYSELGGLPLNNVYKYVKGIIRNASEAEYVKAFGWMEGLTSNNVSSSFKSLVASNDISGAADVLSISFSMYKTGTVDRETLVEISKLSREGFNAVAKNIPDYITNEDGTKVNLTDTEKAAFGKSYGGANKVVVKLIKSAQYKSSDSATKAKLIKKVYDIYYELAKYDTFGAEPDSRLGKLLAYSGGDYDVLQAVLLVQQNASLVETKNQTRSDQAIRLVNRQPMTRVQKLLTLYLMGYGVNKENKQLVRSYLMKLGFSKTQAEEYLP